MAHILDTWEPLVQQAAMTAITRWVTEDLEPALYPALVADSGPGAPDGDPGPMPNIDALLTAILAWGEQVDEHLLPLLVGLVARRMVDTATGRGVPLAEVEGDAPTSGPVADLMAAATAALAARGLSTDGLDRVVWVPSWVDFLDRYVATTRNYVVGMPEGVYRDLVKRLAAATHDGLGPWERARLARDYLDMSAEGGYDQWMTRALRISRTETNKAVNAADLTAARLEEQALGEPLEKVWVATMDPRTRDTHFRVDGQRVPLDGKFLIGTHPADHPGDPALPPHECINCRCALVYLRPGEPLPGDVDRQTERERSDGTTRDPQAEVRARADREVTRARDSEPVTAAAAAPTTPEKENTMRTTFSSLLAPLGARTGDGRVIDADATISFRDMPLPLLWQRATSDGHDTAVVVGKITAATVDAGAIHATGEFLDSDGAVEAAALVAEGVIRPSVDLADVVTEWRLETADGTPVDIGDDGDLPDGLDPADVREVMHVRQAQVLAATLVSKPAFAEAKIVLGEPADTASPSEQEVAALTAAAALVDAPTLVHPADAFADPGLAGPTALTVTEDGRVFGHLALWGTEHVAMPGRAVTPPRSTTGYSLFHVSTVSTTDGPVSCGRLTVGCGHADTREQAAAATAHYDQAGTCWAYVRAGEDQHGIWVAGVVNPDAEPATVRAGAAAPLSGDWRRVGGGLELVAALSVNTPGFPVPRTYAHTAGEELALVAAGAVPLRTPDPTVVDAVVAGLRLHEQQRARERAATERAAQARALAASMLHRRVTR